MKFLDRSLEFFGGGMISKLMVSFIRKYLKDVFYFYLYLNHRLWYFYFNIKYNHLAYNLSHYLPMNIFSVHREVKWVVGGVGVGCGSEGALQGLQGGELYWGLTTLGSTGWQAPLLASCRTWLCNAFDCWLEHWGSCWLAAEVGGLICIMSLGWVASIMGPEAQLSGSLFPAHPPLSVNV